MECTFTLYNLKPLSVNATYINVGRGRAKSSDASHWFAEVFFQLREADNADKLRQLREYFDSHKHVIAAELTAYYPQNIFTTKDGLISAKTMDCTNWEKSIVDAIFLPKFHTQELPYGAPNLNVDDKYLIELKSAKRASFEYKIKITIKVLDWNIENYIG